MEVVLGHPERVVAQALGLARLVQHLTVELPQAARRRGVMVLTEKMDIFMFVSGLSAVTG